MLKRWAAWPPGIRWVTGIAAVVLAAAIVWALFVPLADWLARHDVGSAKGSLATARDAARGRLLTLGAGLFAAGALLFTALNFNLLRRTFELAEQGQVTDRFTKAIEQLGSDKLDVRIGGIYTLERVARDSARDHPTVMEVLTAFIREHSREQWPPSDAARPEQKRLTRPDVQAAVTVAGRRGEKHDILPIDLTGAHLTGAVFAGAKFPGADLTRVVLTAAHLAGAKFPGADLTGADLTGAVFAGAHLNDADLTGANLSHAILSNADLTGATLRGATLTRATLMRAILADAILADAILAGATLAGADLAGADLTDADLTGANLLSERLTSATLRGADLTEVRWPPQVQVPEGWVVDSKSNRLKRADQLSEVIAHYP